MIGHAPHSPTTGVIGWLFGNEENLLTQYASQVPAHGVIVEIGVEFGRSSAALGLHSPKTVTHYCVDLYPQNSTWGDMAHVHRTNLAEAGYTRFTQLQGDSSSVGKEFKGKIDLLFIDGDHSYAGVLRDIEAWTPKVKTGGIVLFHDAAPPTNLTPHDLHFEVQRALNDWLREHGGEWTELPSEYSIRVFRRVGEDEDTQEFEATAEAPKPTPAAKPKQKVKNGK